MALKSGLEVTQGHSLLFSSGQTAVKLSGAEAADRPNALPLIIQLVIEISWWLLQTSGE